MTNEIRNNAIETEYGFTSLDKTCTIAELLANIEATREFAEDFEADLERVEEKVADGESPETDDESPETEVEQDNRPAMRIALDSLRRATAILSMDADDFAELNSL